MGSEAGDQECSWGRLRRRTFRVALGVAVVASVVAVSVGATGVRHRLAAGAAGGFSAASGASTAARSGPAPTRSGSPTRQPSSLGLPTLGGSQAIEATSEDLNDVGDPYVLTVPAGVDGNPHTSYVLYWTTDWNSNVPTAVSSDLIHWRRVADSLPVLPAWAVPSATMTWGPTVHRVGATWVLYYSTEAAANKLECLGRATSAHPTGPFRDTTSAPLVCQTPLGGDIDPSVVTDRAGASALLWKNDGNATGARVNIWEQPLAGDGLSVTGSPTPLIAADQAWEHNIVEGPAMLAAGKGGWWLFYSGGTWQSNTYDTGVAWCATVAGPCHKAANSPLLASTPTAVSPGGFDTFADGNGKLWASYSAFPQSPANADDAMRSPRVLEIAPVLSH
ncbi:MAG: glycoside hydrolase family 43 protein [Actinomycetota bacterium]|nr:glycoside hydrolase family 43 protein [Actinomycetota bacterium]